jgi:N-acetylmuramoyl-L-alanine amidase
LVGIRTLTFTALAAILSAPAVAQAPRRTAAPPLPAIPAAGGPLALTVVYPLNGQLVTARDSTFFFGSTGNGRAAVTINGVPAQVAPNGAFLGYVPLPTDTFPVVRIVARLDADSAVRELRLRLPVPIVPPDSGVWLDRASLSPRGVRWAEPGELIRVSVYASPGAVVSLQLPGRTAALPLAPDTGTTLTYGPFDRRPSRRTERVETRYVGVFLAEALGGPLPSVTQPVAEPTALDSARVAWVTVATERGSVRAPLPLRLGLLDPARRAVVLLDDDTARAGTTDGAVAGTPVPDGTYHWFFPNGTLAAVSGRHGSQVRLALSRTASAWVDVSSLAATLPEATPPPRATLALVRLFPERDAVVARLRLGQRVPFRVDEDERSVTVRLYSTQMDLDWVQYGGTDPFVARVTWAQPTDDEGTVTFALARPVFGWRARWEGTDLVLALRRPPVVNATRPLRGRVIAVDPGHPPAGATGPTGLREAEANLAVAQRLRRLLEAAGARVVMTRTTDSPLGLYERSNLAEAAGAEVLVSIHNNAFPDGVNPWENNGTSTYYYHPRSARLAMLVQQRMVARMGLRDLGVGRGDLALVRPSWMPAVLTEGAFLMIPEQEYALRTLAFQERYARAIVEGIEAWLRETAGGRESGRAGGR